MKKKSKRPAKGVSKFQKARDMFREKKSWTLDEIVQRSGFDERNAKTCLSILKNPKRTKDPLVTHFDKEKRLYAVR